MTRGFGMEAIQNDNSYLSLNGDPLIIAGSGNVALHVYKFAAILGYSITVIDDRPETLTREGSLKPKNCSGKCCRTAQSCDITRPPA